MSMLTQRLKAHHQAIAQHVISSPTKATAVAPLTERFMAADTLRIVRKDNAVTCWRVVAQWRLVEGQWVFEEAGQRVFEEVTQEVGELLTLPVTPQGIMPASFYPFIREVAIAIPAIRFMDIS